MHGPPTACFAPPPSAPSEPSALHASLPPAPVPTMPTLIVHAPTSSVHQSSTPRLAPTSRLPLGSSPPATSSRSRRPSRCARRRRRSRPRRSRWLRIIIAAGDAVHVHDAADHRGNVLHRSGGDDGSQRVGDDDHGAPSFQASPRRPLHLEAVGRAASRPDCLPSLPCGLARLAAFGDIARAHAVRLVDTRRVHIRFRVRLATAGSAVTGFRTSPSCTVHSTVAASAPASVRVLDTTAFTTSRTHRHSVAVAAPIRRVLRPRFPFAHTLGLSFLTACRGFGSHTRRTLGAVVATARLTAL